MSDCPNGDIRDLLPDWVGGRLTREQRAAVGAHLAGCGSCRAEVDVLATVTRLLPAAPPVDVARIVAALPAAPRRSTAAPRPAVVSGPRSVPRSAPRPWSDWRMAAAIVAITVGASAIALRQPAEPRAGGARITASKPNDPALTSAGPATSAGRDGDSSPLLAYVVPDELTPSEYDALVTELESTSEVFTPVAEPAGASVIGDAQ